MPIRNTCLFKCSEVLAAGVLTILWAIDRYKGIRSYGIPNLATLQFNGNTQIVCDQSTGPLVDSHVETDIPAFLQNWIA